MSACVFLSRTIKYPNDSETTKPYVSVPFLKLFPNLTYS